MIGKGMAPDEALVALHRSLDERQRPENVAQLILHALKGRLSLRERRLIGRAALASGRWLGMSSMSDQLTAPVGGARQVAATARLFAATVPAELDADDPASLLGFAADVGAEIKFHPRRDDFLRHRLNREERAAYGLELSKRQYNRRFRALRRVTGKAARLDTEWAKRRLLLVARAGFGAEITRERFLADPWAGCFVAYYTAKRKVRRQFTLKGRDNPYDEIADALYRRCQHNPRTDWWMIAQASSTSDVLAQLTDEQRGELLGRWSATMRETAEMLRRVWSASAFDRESMIVRRGNDSSTWNLLCGAYNAARAGWLACLQASGTTDLLDVSCPGKAMMLMAADLAMWHGSTGSGPHPDMQVWRRLPLPWDVLAGRATCTRGDVERACQQAKVDPERSDWTAPRAHGSVGTFRPTPELVHGVAVVDPVWASALRSAGAFSGKTARDRLDEFAGPIPADVIDQELPQRTLPQPDGRDSDG
jgi:hypothetical protein